MYFSPRDTCTQILHQLHMEMALLSSPRGMFTSANHILFNKASALLSASGKRSCSRSGLWEHTCRSGASRSSSTFLHPTDPSPCLQPPTRARQTARCWTGSAQQSKMTISAFLLCEAIVLCSTCPVLLGVVSVCPPHLLRASHHTRLGHKSLLSHKKLSRQNNFLHGSFPRFHD